MTDVTFSSLSDDVKRAAVMNAHKTGWPHMNDFTVTGTGKQWCLLDGVVENASAAPDRLHQQFDHLAHVLAAHPVSLVSATRMDNTTSTAQEG